MVTPYRGYTGQVVPTERGSYQCYGTLSKLDETTLHISELPLRKWTQDYKETVLEPLLQGDGKGGETFVSDLREHHTEQKVAFTLKVASAANLAEAEKKGLHKQFKLSTALSTSNMTLFDEQGRIHKWETPERVLQDFYSLRLALYNKRKLHLSEMLTQDWSKLDNKLRFVLAVVAGQLKIGGRKKAELVQQLQKDGCALRVS